MFVSYDQLGDSTWQANVNILHFPLEMKPKYRTKHLLLRNSIISKKAITRITQSYEYWTKSLTK